MTSLRSLPQRQAGGANGVDTIKEVGTHDIIMSHQMAKLLGGSGHCRATGYYDLTWSN